jgi:hypothetical protein
MMTNIAKMRVSYLCSWKNIRYIKCDQSRKKVVKEVSRVGDEKCTAVAIFGSIQ